MSNVPEKLTSPIETLTDKDTKERRAFIRSISRDLENRFTDGSEVIEEFAVRRLYSHDLVDIPLFLEKTLFRTTPLVVVKLRSEKDASALLHYTADSGIPLFPRGIASWGFGGAIPTTSGIVADTSFMQRVLSLNGDQKTVTVEPGVKWGELDSYLSERGFALPVYPSNRFSTVGGWISTGGFGVNSFKYGHIRYWTESISLAAPGGGIHELESGTDEFDTVFGSEGQLGLITKVELKVIEATPYSYPCLLHGEDDKELFALVEELSEKECIPSHVLFMDSAHARLVNTVWLQRKGKPGDLLVEEKPSLFLHFDDPESYEKFQALFTGTPGLEQAPLHQASFLWGERFSPMKVQVHGTSLLACELILPPENVPAFMERAKKLASSLKAELFMESHFIRKSTGMAVLIMPMFNCDRRRTFQYYIYLSLVSMLTSLGLRMGGSPYGIGIWNAPMADAKAKEVIEGVLAYKRHVDPKNLMNPGKFWHLRSRFFGLPARVFTPALFKVLLRLLIFISPVIGVFLRKPALPGNGDPLKLTSLRCTGCGNCVTVCHAVSATGEEALAPRSKLRLARKLTAGKPVSSAEADRAFLCTRCGSCEHICQGNLPLLESWDLLEVNLAKSHGRPTARIRDFVAGLGQNEDYLKKIGSDPY